MDNFCPEEIRTGIYRVCDPVKHFKIRVSLKRASPAPIGTDDKSVSDAGNEQGIELCKLQSSSKEEEEYVFSWNEKVFSKKELEIYADERLCTSFLDQKYHEKVISERRQASKTSRLFSYVDADIMEGKFQQEEPIVSAQSDQHILVQHMKGLRLRHQSQGLHKKMSESSVIPSKRIIQNAGSRSHYTAPSYQKMYIMADLMGSENSNVDENDEVVLCEIALDSNGVFMINPDFSTSSHKPYCIRNKENELFQYTLWNASQTMTKEDVESERSIWKKMDAYNSEILAKCIGTDFDVPSEKELKVFITGEIVSAWNFEYDGLCLNYKMELPEGWYSSEPSNLSGTSQTCDTKIEAEIEVAYFGLPLEMELSCLIENHNTVDQGFKLSWPKLYIEVFSLDFWGRLHTEGYTFATLPRTTGTYNLKLPCWRPLEVMHIEKMRRFFIGGVRITDDLTYVGIPCVPEEREISKFGFQTQSSGEILLRLNICHQSLSFIHSGHRKKKKQKLADWLRSGSGDNAVAGVLAAYQRTRQKMLQTRRELELQLSTT